MLKCRSNDKIALIETSRYCSDTIMSKLLRLTKFSSSDEPRLGESLAYSRLSYASLYTQVHHTILALQSLSLKPNDILAYYGPTSTASVILLLATSAIGAIWSSAAADFGSAGVLERFEQFGDRLWGIVGVESVRYNGKTLTQRKKFGEVVKGLNKVRGGKELKVVLVDYLKEGVKDLTEEELPGVIMWEDFLEMGKKIGAGREEKIDFYQASFDHPLWCLFSSGTTGKVSLSITDSSFIFRGAHVSALLQSQNQSFIALEECCFRARKSMYFMGISDLMMSSSTTLLPDG